LADTGFVKVFDFWVASEDLIKCLAITCTALTAMMDFEDNFT
jgi:hypothetical protein